MIGVGTFSASEKAKKYVNQALDSGRLTYGPFTKKFESLFASSHDTRFGIMSNSGTSALVLALNALKNKYGWKEGDEVIVPAITFIATSNIVLQNNMVPVFVDVDPIYYELNPNKIEEAITEKTRCIIPVHLFGCPCDMDPIIQIAEKYNLKMIEDSCESMFVSYKGGSVGSFGEIGCFSTYLAHILNTGVGGICTTNNPELAIAIRSMMNHGRDSIYLEIDDDNDKSADELKLIIKKRFSFERMGYSFRVTELEGALGLAEFEDHEEMMKKRLENGQFFIEQLKPLEYHLQLPTIRPESGHAFMMFPIVLKNEKKDELVQFLEERGIETRDMLPLINQPYYKKIFDINEDDFPVAKWINSNGFYIASHHGLTQTEREYIIETFINYFKDVGTVQKERNCLVIMSKLYHIDQIVLEHFYEALPIDLFDEFILIDDSSIVTVENFFRKLQFKILSGKEGKGAALSKAITEGSSENMIIMGIDGADEPKNIDDILIKLKQGKDLVIASRFLPGGQRSSARPFSYRSIGNRLFTFLINIIFNHNITDVNNTFRGFKRQKMCKLKLREKGESFMFEMSTEAIRSGLIIDEIPTIERTSYAKRKKRNRVLNGMAFIIILLKQLVKKQKKQI